MAFDQRTLELNFAQLKRAVNSSADNVYSDSRKRNYHDQLIRLTEKIEGNFRATLGEPARVQIKDAIDFVFKSLEFLDHSILTMIPFELVFCLEQAMERWIPHSRDEFIIVTSYVNNINLYSFDPSLAKSDIYDMIATRYDVSFSHKLVQINLPKYLATDYLANVVLYHELGHFVDHYYGISKTVLYGVWGLHQSGSSEGKNILQDWFRWTDDFFAAPDKFVIVLLRHLMEYFADTFASTFLDAKCSNYLEFIGNAHQDSETHPATEKRKLFVKAWLAGNPTKLHDCFSETLRSLTLPVFSQMFKPIAEPGFLKLVPTGIGDPDQLHSLFQEGWEVWHGDRADFQKANGMAQVPSAESTYAIINNLIEKSISNFIVKQKWGLLDGASKS